MDTPGKPGIKERQVGHRVLGRYWKRVKGGLEPLLESTQWKMKALGNNL